MSAMYWYLSPNANCNAIAIAFTKLGYIQLFDNQGNALLDFEGKELYAQASAIQNANSWALMQEFYSKTPDGTWSISDIEYEALVDANGELITDSNNETIFVL